MHGRVGPLRVVAAVAIIGSLNPVSLALFNEYTDFRHPLLTTLGAADTPQKVAAVGKRIEAYAAAHPNREVSGEMLWRLGRKYFDVKRSDDALRVLALLLKGWPKKYGGFAWVGMAEVYAARGEDALEMAAFEQARANPSFTTWNWGYTDPDNNLNLAYERLAKFHENEGDWVRALAYWEVWQPSRSFCGNANSEDAHERILRMARCRAHLGQTDRALSDMEGVLDSGLAGPYPRAALAYAELAARTGRLAAAKAHLGTLSPQTRELFAPGLAIVEGFAAKNVEAILGAIRKADQRDLDPEFDGASPEMWAAARLTLELPDGADVLSARILEGDLWAIQLAGLSKSKVMLPALARRLPMAKGSEAVWIRGAMNRLQGAPPRDAPKAP